MQTFFKSFERNLNTMKCASTSCYGRV